MFVSDQARRADSNLCQFLDVHLPQRQLIAETWRGRLSSAPWCEVDVDVDRAHLGKALEIRIGLDLAESPGYLKLLGFLPPDRCRTLLVAAGFDHGANERLPETGTMDPILQHWTRVSRPGHDGIDQQEALEACLDVTALESLAHTTRQQDWAVETQRGFFLMLQEQKGDQDAPPDPTLVGLSRLWRGYAQHGRHGLIGLGNRVLLSPELAPGFAVADLVVGRTLVEIKTSSFADRDMELWLNQILAYLLVDRDDVLHLNQVALYLGWQALTLVMSVDELLRAASAGPTPQLVNLRATFAEALGGDIRDSEHWQLTQRYPVPPEAVQR